MQMDSHFKSSGTFNSHKQKLLFFGNDIHLHITKLYQYIYCCKFLVLFLFLSFLKAQDSICRTLSLLTPISSPISCSVLILPSSKPNLHLTTCFSLGFKLSSNLFRSCFMSCFASISSVVNASGSAITSCNKRSRSLRCDQNLKGEKKVLT